MTKPLTIWIPTYQRPRSLSALLQSIHNCNLTRMAHVVVSDNDPEGPLWQAVKCGLALFPEDTFYRSNPANLSAGVNFLRAFELCETRWLMIVGDDDRFEATATEELESLLESLCDSVLAVKFDSSLFGKQPLCQVDSLKDYLDRIGTRSRPEAFNNLCLISNWLFRTDPYRKQLASAYLGYSSKLSHLFPLLRACELEGGQMLFSPGQPVRHGTTEDSSWPKAATWYEMTMTLSSFSGFVTPADRAALLRLLLHRDWRRYILKCLRVQQFYGDRSNGVNVWRIHGNLALISSGYRLAFLLVLPLLLLPANCLPLRIRQKLGDPGCIERW